MLKIVKFDEIDKVFTFDFMEKKDRECFVVCPNPMIADSIRAKISQRFNFDCLTISKFVSQSLSFQEESLNPELWKKSQVLSTLATAWKRFKFNLPDQAFSLVFQHLTELRSFTLDKSLVEEILEEYGEELAQGISVLWDVYDALDIYDEQRAYFELAQVEKSDEYSIDKKNIIFWNFQFLNSHQVDLLKSLAIRNDIYVPLSGRMIESAIHTDWVNWLGQDQNIIDLEKDKKNIKKNKLKMIYFSKGRLAETLKDLEKNDDFKSYFMGEKPVDVFLSQSKPQLNEVQEIPYSNLNFKTSQEILKIFIDEIFSELNRDWQDQKYTEICSWLEEKGSRELTSHQKSFARFAALKLVRETIEEWSEISQENIKYQSFDARVLKEVALLNSPRSFMIPAVYQKSRGGIYGLEGLENFDSNHLSFVIASSNYQSILGRDNRHSEKMMEFLSAIGPVRRTEFESLFIKQQLSDVLKCDDSYLLCEPDLLESDQFWGDFIEDSSNDVNLLDLKTTGELLDRSQKPAEELSILVSEASRPFLLESISASKLQTYVDCPRKYFFTYLHQLNTFVSTDEILLPNEIGELEHLAIKEFLSLKESDLSLEDSVRKTLSFYLEKNNKKIDQERLEEYLLELIPATSNACQFIQELDISKNAIQLFESPLKQDDAMKGIKTRGSIDYIASVKDGHVLIDFKRSDASIPSKKNIEDFSSLQVWFYLRFLPDPFELKNMKLWGYFCLRDPDKSLLFSSDQDLIEDLKNSSLFSGLTIYKTSIEELTDKCRDFDQVIKEQLNSISNDDLFLANPIAPSVCHFCPVKNVCSKGNH